MIDEMLLHAKRLAYTLTRKHDPEIQSRAGASAYNAVREYNPAKGVPLKAWVSFCVRRDMVGYWRDQLKRREVQVDWNKAERDEHETGNYWQNFLYTEDEDCELLIPREDYELLCERYFEKWPWDVVAKMHNVTIKRAREMVAAAEQKLKEAYNAANS